MNKTFAHLYSKPGGSDMMNVPLSFERVPIVGEYIHVWLSDEQERHFKDTGSGTTVFRVAHVDLTAAADGSDVEYPSELYAMHVPRETYLERRRKALETTK